MLTAALFTIAKAWKQPKCPSTDDGEEDVVHIYNGKYSAIKRNEIMLFAATWMQLEIVTK